NMCEARLLNFYLKGKNVIPPAFSNRSPQLLASHPESSPPNGRSQSTDDPAALTSVCLPPSPKAQLRFLHRAQLPARRRPPHSTSPRKPFPAALPATDPSERASRHAARTPKSSPAIPIESAVPVYATNARCYHRAALPRLQSPLSLFACPFCFWLCPSFS